MNYKYPNLIAHIRRYVHLTESEISVIEFYFKPLDLKRKEILLSEGKICTSNFFVEKGCIRMYYINEKLVEQTTQFALDCWWLSDYFSFAKQSPTQYFIQAVEKSTVLAIEYQLQDKLFEEIPQLERYFRIMMQRALAASQLRIKLIYELSKEEMYRHFNTSFPQFFQRVPQYMIASYLGLTPEYLSELRKKG